ncbi:F-box protein [Phanerochaete sordida]|uniref:F-box protein n=1 Tax=Phanerochaete sordida TaxID=48140 RepID=A0A9P3LJT0_9APHY|nr:F-box protein [Phanerochaete sordida]
MAGPILTDVDEDVLVDIFHELSVRDVLKTRQTCKRLCEVTIRKTVWVNILRRDVLSAHLPFPEYCRPVQDLTAAHIEALVKHALCTDTTIRKSYEMHPFDIAPLHQKRSVTWVKLVHARWLIVASSDASSSVLSVWPIPPLALNDGDRKPLSEMFLSGPVQEGALDIRSDGDERAKEIIVALDVCSPVPSIQVFQLCQDQADIPRFSHLATLSDAGHLRALRGATLCFALHRELSVPCIWDWKSDTVTRLAERPDHSGGCIAMDIHANLVAAATPEHLTLYTLHSARPPSARTLMHFRAELGAADVLFTPPPSPVHSPAARPGAQLHIALSDALGLAVLRVTDLATPHQPWPLRVWAPPPAPAARPEHVPCELAPRFGPQALSVGWVDAFEVGEGAWRAAGASVPEEGQGGRCWRVGGEGVAWYASAVRDVDEGLGMYVVGNMFGELVVARYGGLPLEELEGCFEEIQLPVRADDAFSQATVQYTPAPPFPYTKSPSLHPTSTTPLLALWSAHHPHLDAATLPAGWHVPAATEPLAPLWRTLLTTVAARLRAKHFHGTPVPLLHDEAYTRVVFSVGGVTFVWFPRQADSPPATPPRSPASEPVRSPCSPPISPTSSTSSSGGDDAPDVLVRVPPGVALRDVVARLDAGGALWEEGALGPPVFEVPLRALWREEVRRGRDRWREMRERAS